ncbi:hypothetical protein EAI_14537 [Harpegnathos saltator]|uniref:Uncharacterized protein n=1 Tax=Harpegnathos saltator TaxID=610380 RepID=E2C420_HARSA|nr:hypothetical protein EAI_14537 [Harpegnathos saltator]
MKRTEQLLGLAARTKMTTELSLIWECTQTPETLGQSNRVTLMWITERIRGYWVNLELRIGWLKMGLASILTDRIAGVLLPLAVSKDYTGRENLFEGGKSVAG